MAVRLKFGNDLNIFGGSRGAGGFLSTPVFDGGYPAYGTILSTGTEPMTSSFTYAASPYTAGAFEWGNFPSYTRADGAGGSYLDFSTGFANGTETAVYNQVMNDDALQTTSRIIYQGGYGWTSPAAGTWVEYPRYGVYAGTYYTIEYVNGATVYSIYNATPVLNQNCDVDYYADGLGGTYIDWETARNVSPKNDGDFVASSASPFEGNPVEVPSSSNNYFNSGTYDSSNEVHNGTGGLRYFGTGNFTPYSNGTYISFAYDSQTQVPNGGVDAGYFSNGQFTNYVWDGIGGYTYSGGGSYYTNGTEVDGGLRYTTNNLQTEVPAGSGAYYDNGKYNQDTYYWDGSGGSYASALAGNPQNYYFSFGTMITQSNCPNFGDDGSNYGIAYFWDGNNGWFIAGYP